MKKHVFLLFSVLGLMTARAQVGGGFVFYQNPSNDWDTLAVDQHLYFDINGDGEADLEFYTFEGATGSYTIGSNAYTMNDWDACCYRTSPIPGYDNFFLDLTLPLNDTSLVWKSICLATQYEHFPLPHKVGLRVVDDGIYYYGWAEFEVDRYGAHFALFHLSKTCFCTIPDYPLLWGQTDLTDINETSAFATLYPNPTTGLVRIMGKDLKSAKVVNTLGQCVATAQGKGCEMNVDIAHLPAGVYFVRITDEEGRKCVRKVVKE